jgi:hypothetical protein
MDGQRISKPDGFVGVYAAIDRKGDIAVLVVEFQWTSRKD